MLRDTYAEINTGAFKKNLRELLKAAEGTPLMAVVKADAYGHGAARMARCAAEEGVNWFAVSNPDEAIEIRETIGKAHILVLSSIMDKACESVVKNDISVAAYEPEHITALEKAAAGLGKKALVHLKADTGMGRIGFRTVGELKNLIAVLKSCKNVIPEGLFMHFATADEKDLSFSEKQLEIFKGFKKTLADNGLNPICHAANSAGITALPEARFDICRAGISMYGYPASKDVDLKGVVLTPVMSFKSYVSCLKEIDAGESVSYGRTFIAKDRMKVATVSAGYADGYLRALSNKAKAFVNGSTVRQIGRVCMDQIMLDVTGVDVKVGDEVELFGEHITAQDLAEIAGTISYELLTGVAKRVPRVYI